MTLAVKLEDLLRPETYELSSSNVEKFIIECLNCLYVVHQVYYGALFIV